ncbi:hypothetical protein [Amaricoccus solimangrovi]|uniref:hypothetical protein n=1 Tax=Amaricoccus solimangrovi TaxID=2589815 RepID=UPI0015E3DDE9|nr:hypothetical protein [Amaricoccus solimangrovi]
MARAAKAWFRGIALALLAGCAAAPRADQGGLRAGPARGGGFERAGAATAPAPGAAGAEAFALSFDDALAPGIYQRDLLGRRDRPKGTQGLWATVPDLRRAERARLVNLATGATVDVALFRGSVPAGEARISNAAAALLGIGAEPARLRVTALRREPVLVAP